ncbi:MAG: pantothenate kinase [Moorea sp. SIO4A1]|nr:pantothenate kinase [Moorena sp. SIO4A1]NEQ57716.1 pantothenate kinase [Moorena sp. SIO4A1]
MTTKANSFLGLVIGNSRLHWAWFVDNTLKKAWDTNHLTPAAVAQLIKDWRSNVMSAEILPPQLKAQGKDPSKPLPLYIASVVPAQTALWQNYSDTTILTLEDLPLSGLYPTLGIDRALAVFGAGHRYSYPVLVIDAGTALTFTGANQNLQLIGGAILPGLGLQLQSLAQNTGALPAIELPAQLPKRWSLETSEAMASGVVYTVLASIRDFIEDWQSKFPNSQIALTGGDSEQLVTYLQSQFPEIAAQIIVDPYLIFWGMLSVVGG